MYFLIFAYWYVFPLKIIYSITRYVGGKYFVFVKTNARYVGGATKRVQNTKKVQPDLTLTSYSIKKKIHGRQGDTYWACATQGLQLSSRSSCLCPASAG